MDPKEYRLTVYAYGKEHEGAWIPYDPVKFADLCVCMAGNKAMFTVEFR